MSTTTDDVASQLHAAIAPADKPELDPLTIAAIVALIQSVMQVVMACFPEPEELTAWIEGEWRPQPGWLVPGMRPWRIRRMVAQQWNGDRAYVPHLAEAVLNQCRRTDRRSLFAAMYDEHRPRAILLAKPFYGSRSWKWSSVRSNHLEENPTCAVCGTRDYLEVHHIVPFHVDRSLELEPTNLLTMCESPTRNCHFIFGHLMNWRTANPQVRAMAAKYLALRCEAKEQLTQG